MSALTLAPRILDAFARHGLTASVLDDVRAGLRDGSTRDVATPALPVAQYLDELSNGVSEQRSLLAELQSASASLYWGQTYREPDVTAQFLKNYGWAEIWGGRGPMTSSTSAGGVLLLGPQTTYPKHGHRAIEYYLPLYGRADWFDELRGWRTVSPLTLIHHPSGVAHAMRTYASPLLAAYLWIGEGLHETAAFQASREPSSPSARTE